MLEADRGFTTERILGGLASGEGLIAAVSDGTRDKDDYVVGELTDKRLLVYEPEFSRVLKVCARDFSTLSAIFATRGAVATFRVMTRANPLRATGGPRLTPGPRHRRGAQAEPDRERRGQQVRQPSPVHRLAALQAPARRREPRPVRAPRAWPEVGSCPPGRSTDRHHASFP